MTGVPMRKIFICGNWKMYKTGAEAAAFMGAFAPLVKGVEGVEIGIAPPLTALGAALGAASGSGVLVGAQNVHWAEQGAFTGEVSAGMLKEAGAAFAIVGHSERRQFFGETDETVGMRAKAALEAGLTAIVCVGESLGERDRGEEFAVVGRQLTKALTDLDQATLDRLVVAYEPVWAIGTGRTASAAQAQQMHAFLRDTLKKIASPRVAEATRILYGGSVKPENAAELLGMEDIDGALVGGASLVAETFASIVRFRV